MKKKFLIPMLTGFCVCLMGTTLLSACNLGKESASSIENTQTENSLFDSDNEETSSSSDGSVDSSIDSNTESSVESSIDSSSDTSMDLSSDSISDSAELAPHAHDFAVEIIENTYLKAEATCESKAVYYYACVCGEQNEKTFEYGEALGHDTTQHEAKEATCTEKGWGTYETCSRCDYTSYVEIPAFTHLLDTHQAKAPTCAENGWEEYVTCKREGCKYTTYTEIPVIDHPFASEWAYNATHHWHESTCDCGVKADFEQHAVEDSGWCSVCRQAVSSTNGIRYEVSADGTHAKVVAYLGTSSKVNIASAYDGVPVTSISSNAFENTAISAVIIPDSVTSIGSNAFSNCGSLTSIIIPDSVTRMDSYTFYNCSNLTSVEIGDGVTSIGDQAFYNCSSLTSAVIGDSVSLIGNYAFEGCSSLTSIAIPDSVTAIGCNVFSGCSSLENIIFEDPNAWYRTINASNWNNKAGGISVDVTNSSVNVTYFKSKYDNYYWYKL